MTDAVLSPARLALVGNPNSGKTALFNALTGSRQKVANYAGVTVERKEGQAHTADGRALSVLDLPGTYSLTPTTLDVMMMLPPSRILGSACLQARNEPLRFTATTASKMSSG